MKTINLALLTIILLSSLSLAEEITLTDVKAKYSNNNKIEASKELKQSLKLGFSSTTGNTKTLNINGKYSFSFATEGYAENLLKVGFDTSAFFTETNKVKSNEEYLANIGFEQDIDSIWLGYMGIKWLKNPDFKNYNNKVSLNLGLGKELFNDGKQLLIAKVGIAYNLEDYANTQESERFGSLNEFLEYKNQLNKISNLYLKAGAMQNFDDMKKDYEGVGVLGVKFAVGENINLSIEEELSYDNLPPEGFKKIDTKSIIRLGYNF
jgi:putative salt-induced outer membrane protein YdiY